MIFHELPKTIYFCIKAENKSSINKWKVLQFWRYIDPIGLLFCVIANAGFSKPHMLQLQSGKLNRRLGMIGFSSLIIQFLSSVAVLKYVYQFNSALKFAVTPGFGYEFGAYIMVYIAINSLGMFFTNCIPLTFTDIGIYISGKSAILFLKTIKNDMLIKLLTLFILLIGIISKISFSILAIFLR